MDKNDDPQLHAATQAVAAAVPEIRLISMEGGVWACSPVSERPEVVLEDWRVYEVKMSHSEVRTRHLVGYNITDGEGRASSAIVSFDSAALRGITESGRVYELRGRPGSNGDADYTWGRWKRFNAATDIVDVTSEVFK